MKTTHAILALLLVALAATFVSAGEEPEVRVKHHVKMMIADSEGGEPIEIDAEDMEVGETRQFFTDSGKEVLLTRTEEGYDLEVDGEKIDVGMTHGHHAMKMSGENIFIHKRAPEGVEEEEHVFIHHGDGDFTWVEDGEEGFEWVGHTSALQHLRDKGILDELDEETRQKIVDALEEIEPGEARVKKMVMIKVDEEIDEEIHEDHDDE